jgi:hypothetical protein
MDLSPSRAGIPSKRRPDNFEAAVNAQAGGGWVVFDRIDHAAAQNAGFDMRPRTVIIFGNPKADTLPMTKSATLATRFSDEGTGLAGRSGQSLHQTCSHSDTLGAYEATP